MNRRPERTRSAYEAFSENSTGKFRAAVPDKSFFEKKKRKIRLLSIVLWITAATLVLNALANGLVLVRREEVPVTGMKEAFDGYTVLQISDLKGAQFGSGQARLREAIRRERYDLVVLTGDMVSPHGNAQPLYELIDMLKALKPDVPIYFIPGDADPEPISMNYAPMGSPFAAWVLGAQQRGAQMLGWPVCIERDGSRLWLTTEQSFTLDIETMQGIYEQQYLRAVNKKDDNELDIAKYSLMMLENTRSARKQIRTEEDVLLMLSHMPDMENREAMERHKADLVLCGHYLGGVMRLPGIGPVLIPSQTLPFFGLFPGKTYMNGLTRLGSTYVHVSSGLGAGDSMYPMMFFRLFNPPSVSLITLTPSAL